MHQAPARSTAAAEQAVQNRAKASVTPPNNRAVTCSAFFTLELQCLRHGQCVNRLENLWATRSWQEKGTRRAAQVAPVQQHCAQAGSGVWLLNAGSVTSLQVPAVPRSLPSSSEMPW